MKLDVSVLRYMSKEEFRVLTAVEMGMRNHGLVPTPLIANIAGVHMGAAYKLLGELHRNKLVFHDSKNYDGYRLTYMGYDFLAIKTLSKRGKINAVGSRIGVGKESDIYQASNEDGDDLVLKIHRLGRTSFRNIKNTRDYLNSNRKSKANWLYMSRIAAMREFAYMEALHEHAFPTPTPIDQNRHIVVMSRVDARPFTHVHELKRPKLVYKVLMKMISRLAEHGLIHCDFNEFNLMIDDDENVTLIDFPQMVSTSHMNAKEYFDRDVQCIVDLFEKRFQYVSDFVPEFESEDTSRKIALDDELVASGSHAQQERNDNSHDIVECMLAAHNNAAQRGRGGDGDDEEYDEDQEEEEEEEESPIQSDDDDEKKLVSIASTTDQQTETESETHNKDDDGDQQEEQHGEEAEEDGEEEDQDDAENEQEQTTQKKTKRKKKKSKLPDEEAIRAHLTRKFKQKKRKNQGRKLKRNQQKNRTKRQLKNEIKASR
eukprot:TRINITY_DN67325_c0_g1_i1.p1 TRINITY_DN67325_c0_g1~~TRINITY_DN67325_c0_g1_i1.p1  ORF type:complete len:522 (-),score=265.74 TRINITY_DN67325_c0_g1_i1:46-1503(-)